MKLVVPNDMRPTRRSVLSWAAALTAGPGLLGSIGCRGPRVVSLRGGPREYVAADYEAILNRWTRDDRLYSLQGIDDVLSVNATYEAWDFRWAYVIRYAEDYRLTIPQRRELLLSALDDSQKYHQFYVALYGGHKGEGDLTRDNPAWVLRLVDDHGHVTAPEQIVSIRKPGVLEKTYFPYTNIWRQAYRVRFPTRLASGLTVDPDSTRVSLRFSGPLGNLELHWVQAR